MSAFFGGFHPLIVHLPIGILLVAILFELISGINKYRALQSAILPLLFLSAITAIISCITGLLLASGGEYDIEILTRHKWMGIITAFFSASAWVLKKDNFRFRYSSTIYKGLCIFLLATIVVTGHLGGTLTHGSGFLTKNLPESVKTAIGIDVAEVSETPITNVQEAKVYDDLVMRIINKKCVSCHGPDKQKGKLRLDREEFILKGGKDGLVIKAGSPEESELIKRILLPLNDDDHMPPKEKKQLTPDELELLHWWIKTGADFNKKVMEYAQTDSIKSMLLGFQTSGQISPKEELIIPKTQVAAARLTLLDSLKKSGVLVQKIDPNNNYLSVSFLNTRGSSDSILHLVSDLKDQVLFLNLSGKKISDSSVQKIGELQALRKLYLQYSDVNDTTISKLNSLQNLEYLNLVGTPVTYKGLESIKDLRSLKQLFLFQSGVTPSSYQNAQLLFPKAGIDTGGYQVPILASDTTIYKLPKKENQKKP
ncbi:c-type cytochrome domain-containing protein [Pollutibacter soli]|uniref:c-type cytochrome domain-containing protein n=1 Tax=Pollutibacter soli TaxID=3034157 RepID=UPI003013EB52